MIKVAMNIGGGTGTYSNVPMFWEMENAREFTDFIREQMFNILLHSHDNHGIKSNCWIGVHIHEDIDEEKYFEWDFIINCKNIREFKSFEKMTRDQMDSMRVERDRNNKLNNILND
jgi:hypothetical protein